ncbi:MAG: DMT family transporter [Alphaproteobacteria bacterium]|nr:DMT family transporter [Alphaproteobacteria bacterium]
MSPEAREQAIGWGWITAMVVIWTGFHMSGRIGADLTLTPFDLTTLRFAVAGLLFLPWLLRHGLGGISFAQALLLAMTAGPGFAFFAFAGYQFAPAAHGGAILSGALPLCTAPLAWWLAGERMSTARILSVTMIFAGVLFLVFDATSRPEPNVWIGDLSFFIGAASWSVFAVLARKWGVTPIRSAAIVATFSAATFTPVHLLFLPSNLLAAPWQEVAAQWVFQGIIVFFGSTFGYPRAVAALGATATATGVAIVPAAVTVIAWVVLGETLDALAIGGVVLVVTGILAGTLRFRTRRTARADDDAPATN